MYYLETCLMYISKENLSELKYNNHTEHDLVVYNEGFIIRDVVFLDLIVNNVSVQKLSNVLGNFAKKPILKSCDCVPNPIIFHQKDLVLCHFGTSLVAYLFSISLYFLSPLIDRCLIICLLESIMIV